MLLPLLGLGLQTAGMGGSWLQSGSNRRSQERTIQREQQFARDMYERQRFDAMMDWRIQNKYNHPTQQMQRLKEAGLNPHLIYGTGSAATTAAPARSSSVSTPNFQPPQHNIDFSPMNNMLESFTDLQMKQQQTDNLKKQAELLTAERANKDMDTINKGTEGERSRFELDKAKQFKDLLFQELTLRNEKIKTETANIPVQQQFESRRLNQKDVENAIRGNEYRLHKARTMAEIEKVHEDILRSVLYRETNPLVRQKMEAEIANLKRSGALQDVEVQLKQMGLTPGTPEYWKRWTSLVNEALHAIGQLTK